MQGLQESEAVMIARLAGRTVALTLAGVIAAAGLFAAEARAGETFQYDETNVRPAVYFAALSNLANAVMFLRHRRGAGDLTL